MPTIKVWPAAVAWGRVRVTVPPEAGSRLKVAFWISEMAGGGGTGKPFGKKPGLVLGLVGGNLPVPKLAVERIDMFAVSLSGGGDGEEVTLWSPPQPEW